MILRYRPPAQPSGRFRVLRGMDRREGIDLTADDRDRLQHLVKDGNTAQKHVRRARIVIAADTGRAAPENDDVRRRHYTDR